MKKFFCVLLVSALCMSGCSNDNPQEISETNITEETTKVAETTDTTEATEAAEARETTEVEDSDSSFNKNLEPVSLGMLDVAEFGVGSLGSDIEAAMGKPIDEGYFMGGLYMSYGSVVFLTNGTISDNGKADYGQVTYVSYTGDDYVLGIKIGMTIAECSAIIGEPDKIIPYVAGEEESELYGENCVATYHVGEYNLDLLYENEDAGISQVIVQRQLNN